jgi:hypothetical protein
MSTITETQNRILEQVFPPKEKVMIRSCGRDLTTVYHLLDNLMGDLIELYSDLKDQGNDVVDISFGKDQLAMLDAAQMIVRSWMNEMMDDTAKADYPLS